MKLSMEAVLRWLAGRYEVLVVGGILAPGEHEIAGELGAIVGHDHFWFAPLRGDVVDYVEDAEAAGRWRTGRGQSPANSAPWAFHQDRASDPHSLAPSPSLADGESFPAIKPVDPRRLAVPLQQDEQPAVTETPPLVGEISPRSSASGGRLER